MPPEHSTASERRQHRIDHGLCPICGEEAAPFYLCHDHRTYAAFERMLNRMSERGIAKKEKIKGKNYWSIPAGWNGPRVEDFHWNPRMGELKLSDKRLRPRMGRRPIDLEDTLVEIFREAGKPLTMEEVHAAWGALRSKRKTASLAGDMVAIIKAQRRREERNAKRLTSEPVHA
jgi:hypothetical protein